MTEEKATKKIEDKKEESIKEKEMSKKENKGIETKPEEKTEDKKDVKQKQIKPKTKKYEAVVNAHEMHISTKYSAAICKFIKGKRIDKAISDLEGVERMKKAVPMKGEIAHRKGKGMMSGKFPIKASGVFIKMLKSLEANASMNEINDPVITSAVANLASRPFGKRGSVRKKRTHIKLVAKEIKEPEKNSKKKQDSKKSKENKK